MKISQRSVTPRRAAVAAAAALAVGVGTIAGPAYADPVASTPVNGAAVDCPQPKTVSDGDIGLVGEGWTVVRGGTPQPFKVEVLGVLKDGIGAGRDLILIEASDLPGRHVVDAGGGIWAGMSGSPVYVGGKLIGAVSYGFTYAPSPIGGLTPAADMLDLLGLTGSAAVKPDVKQPKTKVTLTANERKSINARAAASVPGAVMDRLPTPVSVSGLSAKRLAGLQREFDAAGRSVITYAGSRASSGTAAPAARPKAGGNFAAALTYGDVSFVGVGTTTAVCGDKALAFGHPMDFVGKVTYGANDATSLAIVKDSTFGSFKMASVGGSFGTVDQDRLSGLRARLGAAPKTVPVKTTIVNADRKRTRTGTTQVAQPDYLTAATSYGIWANYDSTFDKIGRGLATTSWTITGTRAGGKKFTVSRYNRFSDLEDPTGGPVREVSAAVDALTSNEYEPVTVTGVTFSSQITSAYQQLRITKVAVSVNGGKYTTPKLLKVKAGAKIKVRVTMRAYRSAKDENLVLEVTVPKNTGGRTGALSVLGGLNAPGGESAGSLNSVIKDITSAPRNNQVIADLSLDEPESGSGKAIDVTASKSKRAPVVGERSIEIEVRR